jgi:hypothetical protein
MPYASFRRKSLDRLGTLSLSNGPESSVSEELKNVWTPFFNGVTTSHEAVNFK